MNSVNTITVKRFTRHSAALLAGTVFVVVLRAGVPGLPQPETTVRIDLRSDYLPTPVRLANSGTPLELRSVALRGELRPDGTGEGVVELDARSATLSEFGDVTDLIGPAPELVPVVFRRLTLEEFRADSWFSWFFGRRQTLAGLPELFELSFPGNHVTSTVRLKLGSPRFGPHRLLVYPTTWTISPSASSGTPQVITLAGEPSTKSTLPDRPWSESVKLDGTYYSAGGTFRRIALEGVLGGRGELSLDPNRIHLGPFGDGGMLTAIGFTPYEVTIRSVDLPDPLGRDRCLYQVVSGDPRNTNRCFLVLGRTEAAPHRLLLYKGDTLRLIVPVVQPDRLRHERALSELEKTSPREQHAIAVLQHGIGYEFGYEVTEGRITSLNVLSHGDLNVLDAGLPGLIHLEDVTLRGHLSAPGLPSLAQLGQLRHVYFIEVGCPPEALAFLEELDQIESLNLYSCRSVDDTVLGRISEASRLRSLDIYDELRPGESLADIAHVTDHGLAQLSKLGNLESLTLFGQGLTDASIPVFAGLTNLSKLTLYSSGVSLRALLEFASRSQVEQIHAVSFAPSSENDNRGLSLTVESGIVTLGGQVDDQSLQALTAWPDLQSLMIRSMGDVTDEGLRPLATLTNLDSLFLCDGRQLTDDALKHLKELTHLHHLSLAGCRNISNAGLVHLQGLTSLGRLNLRSTRISDRGAALLLEHLPDCKIER